MRMVSWRYTIPLKLRSLFRWRQADGELDEELREHVARKTEEYVAKGMSAQQARRQAMMDMGGVEQANENCRDTRGIHFVESLVQDIRFALRMLRKSPGFTAVAVLTLALGIGANTAIFSILEAQFWKPLPFPDSDQLVAVFRTFTKYPDRSSLFLAPDYPAWTAAAKGTFAGVCAFQGSDYHNTPGTDTAEMINARPVSSSFFETLHMTPTLGRAFLPDEEQQGHDREVILSYAFWQRHYGANSKVVGEPLVLDGSAYTIVGVAPAGLHFEIFGDPDLYVPLVLTKPNKFSRSGTGLVVVARLKPGMSLRAAQAQMDVIASQIAQQYPERDANHGLKIEELRNAFSPQHQGLFFFVGAAVLVLLIACVNVAGLLLARGLARQREFALRAALGAGRRTLLCQLLVEGAPLGIIGGALGVLAALWSANTLNALLPEDFLSLQVAPQMDARVLAFAVGVALVAAIASALAPGLFASRVDLTNALRQNALSTSGSSGPRRLRSALVIGEVTVAVTLLFGAGLFLNSFVRQMRAPLGFDPHNLLSIGLTFSDKRYSQPQNLWLAQQQILARVRAVPGIKSAVLASQIPFAGGIGASFSIVGKPIPPAGEKPSAIFSSVTPDYFRTLGIPVLAGRSFDENDSADAPHVVVVNQNFADEYSGGKNPLGAELDIEHVGFDTSLGSFRVRIIGVVHNTHMFGPNEAPFDFIYAPTAQVPVTSLNVSVFLVASTALPVSSVLGPIRHEVAQVDKSIPITNVATMDERVDESLKSARGNLILIGIFAGLAAVLVAVGIFGAIAYFVEQRTREFGIRMALGSSRAGVLWVALKHSAVLGISGIILGIGFSFALGRILGSELYLVRGQHDGLLYGVSIFDPLTLAASCTFLIAALFLASYIPARRAMKVDPMVALRYE